MGGLATAIDLAVQGIDVTILERAAAPGGKMRELLVAGRQIDAGPTVFTMRWVFEALFAHAGENLGDHLTMRPATTLARHSWTGEQKLDLFADRARAAEAIGEFAGAKEAKGYLALCAEAKRIYDTLEGPFIRSARPTTTGLIRAAGIRAALRLKPFEPFWTELGKHLKDKRLRQLFGRYTTYCGTSPFDAPATLMLVAHVEQEGVWLIEGGMQRLADAMTALAQRRGVTIRYDTHVSEIMVASGRVNGVRITGGEVVTADAVVFNGEPTALASGLLGSRVRSAAPLMKFPQRSLSATTWAAIAETAGAPLLRHNLFFSNDYPLEFKLIQNGMLPTEATTYICAQDRPDTEQPGAPPLGPERLLILVNAPPSGDRRAFSQVEIDQCMQGVSSLLQRCGVQIRLVEPPIMTTPATFHRLFPSSGGALYGPAVKGGMASFKRPASRTSINGLYLAGGGTHPGAGVPMATLSGRQAAASVIADLAKAKPAKARPLKK